MDLPPLHSQAMTAEQHKRLSKKATRPITDTSGGPSLKASSRMIAAGQAKSNDSAVSRYSRKAKL